jgi:hypothetical protein
MVGSVVVLRGAREALRAFAGPGAGLRAFGVGFWLATTFVSLSLFGRVLRSTTHHHALAGVTFAIGALVVAAGLGLASARIVGIAAKAPPVARVVFLGLLAALAGLGLVYVGLHFVRAASHDAASYAVAGTVVDVAAFALAAVFASRRVRVARRALAMVGPPVAVAVAALGLTMLHDASLRDAIDARAPAYAAVTGVLSGR